MADVVLFHDSFTGGVGPLSAHDPEVGSYRYRGDGALNGAGQLLLPSGLYGSLASAPVLVDAASTYTATAVFGGSGASNRAGFGLFAGDDPEILLGLTAYVDASNFMYLEANTPGGLIEASIGVVTPDQPLTVALEISQTGAKASLGGTVSWSSDQLKTSDVASMPLETQVWQATSSALTVDDLILVQTTAEGGGGGGTPEEPETPPPAAASSLPPGFDVTWEAAQEVRKAASAPAAGGFTVRMDFNGPFTAAVETSPNIFEFGPAPAEYVVGVPSATWYAKYQEVFV